MDFRSRILAFLEDLYSLYKNNQNVSLHFAVGINANMHEVLFWTIWRMFEI